MRNVGCSVGTPPPGQKHQLGRSQSALLVERSRPLVLIFPESRPLTLIKRKVPGPVRKYQSLADTRPDPSRPLPE
jgi:hypothetical protein